MPPRLPKRLQRWFVIADAAGHKYGLDPLLILAVLDRESAGGLALKPPGPAGVGDKGHGLGLMQIDHRFHPLFAGEKLADLSPAWADPARNIDYGAKLLHDNMLAFAKDEFFAVAAYNAGVASVRRALLDLTNPATLENRHEAADRVTTHTNYASDVMGRRTQLRIALGTPEESTNV